MLINQADKKHLFDSQGFWALYKSQQQNNFKNYKAVIIIHLNSCSIVQLLEDSSWFGEHRVWKKSVAGIVNLD